MTSNTAAAEHPGNVFLPAATSGLPKDSVVNVSRLATVSRAELDGPVGRVALAGLRKIDEGMRLVLAL